MSRKANHDLRSTIAFRRVELRLENPLLPITEINRMVAAEVGLSVSMVHYYLRSESAKDRRTRYSDDERVALCRMSRKELQAYATRKGKSFETLYAMVWRHKNKVITEDGHLKTRAAECTRRGHFDFSRRLDLQAFSLPADAFKTTRKEIKSLVPDLDLIPPNYITHRAQQRFYPLSLSEQMALLTAPKRFLKENGARIAKSWRSMNPNSHYFILLEAGTETDSHWGRVVSTHDSFEATTAAMVRSPDTKIHRCFGDTKSPLVHYQPGDLVVKYGLEDAGQVDKELDKEEGAA